MTDSRALTGLLRRAAKGRHHLLCYARARREGLRSGVEIGDGSRFHRNVRCIVAPGGRIVVGQRVKIMQGTKLVAGSRATLTIGDDCIISHLATIAATGRVSIARESLIGEFVMIRDHDHDPGLPPGSHVGIEQDVAIGERVWIGAKASVVRGGSVGDDAVIGAHALVNKPVPAACMAAGVPARVMRENIR